MPLIGRDLISSMDAGIIKVSFETDTDMSIENIKKVAVEMEKTVLKVH